MVRVRRGRGGAQPPHSMKLAAAPPAGARPRPRSQPPAASACASPSDIVPAQSFTPKSERAIFQSVPPAKASRR